MVPPFRVGHPSYTGKNAMKQHWKYGQALADLLSRGVPMRRAHNALKLAMTGAHATCSTMKNGFNTDVVEVVHFKRTY